MALARLLLLLEQSKPLVLTSVGILAFGMSITSPNLAAVVSRNGGAYTEEQIAANNKLSYSL